MSVRGHGKSRVESPRARDLAAAIPAVPSAPIAHKPNGTFANSEAARAAGHLGGKRRAENERLLAELRTLGGNTHETDGLRKALSARGTWLRVEAGAVASEFGGGKAGAGVLAILGAAAKKLGASDWCFATAATEATNKARAELLATGSRLSDSARLDLIAARELAAREANARRVANPTFAWNATLARLTGPVSDVDEPDEEEAGDEAKSRGESIPGQEFNTGEKGD